MKSIFSKILAFVGFMMISSFIFAQNAKTVTGTITDNGGIPLPGVNIYIEGTSTGAISDIDGKYQIPVANADKAVLVYSFIGFVEQKIQVAGKTTINIVLEEQSFGLDEVVAIGYGTVKKRDLTGAVSSVKTEELKQAPVANVAQALQGKLAGVAVSSQDGRPGADVSIRIRGGSSITQSNDPLVVIDGVPGGSLSDVPADQIETIDILKDASSTAIYGSNGANGVILITTKGLNTKVGKTHVSYSGYIQSKSVSRMEDVLSAQQYVLHNWSYMTAYGSSAATDVVKYFGLGEDNGNHYAEYANVDIHNYTNDLLRQAMTQEHNISVSSASEKTTIAFNANMIKDDGIKIKSGFERYNASLKLEHKLYDNISVGFNMNYVQSKSEGNEKAESIRGSILSSAYMFLPIDSVKGDITARDGFGDGDRFLDETYNPYTITMNIEDITESNKARGIAYINWDLIKGLTLRSEISGSTSNSEAQYYNAGIALPNDDNRIDDREARLTLKRGYAYRSATTINWDVQGLGSDHDLSFLGGFELSKSQSSSTRLYGRNFPANFDFQTAMAKIQLAKFSEPYTIINDDGETEIATYSILKNNFDFYNNIGVASTKKSYFGRASYSFQGKYLVNATLRADGSSKFAPNNSWGYFPAGALGWRISDEAFFADTKSWLDNLKLRLSIGTAGSDNIPYSAWNSLYSISFAPTGLVTYKPIGVLPNEDLKWETTVSRNIGIDYNLFDNHIYGAIEIYSNYTKDLLGEVPAPEASGFTSQFQNIGKTSNKGIEISFGASIVRKKDFSVSVNATYNYNKNNIEELADGIITEYGTKWNSTATYPSKEFIFKEGTPVGSVKGFIYDGYYSPEDFNYDETTGVYTLKDGVVNYVGENFSEMGNYPSPFGKDQVVRIDSNGTAVAIGSQIFPGALKIKDTNEDGEISLDDATTIAEMIPRHTGGFGLNVFYKGFDLNANFTYALGGHVYNIARLANTLGNKEYTFGANKLKFIEDAYKVYDVDDAGNLEAITNPQELNTLNANAKYHLPYYENGLILDKFIEKSDYLRLNSLTVGYTLPKDLTRKAKIERARIYFTGGNLLTITGYSGLDPEVSADESKGAYPTPGLDFGAYPRAKTFTFGVNIDF